MSTTITIQGLPLVTSVQDATYFPTETGGITSAAQLITLKNYMTTLPNLTVAGSIGGTLVTGPQPNITSLGTLVGMNTSGQIVSTFPDSGPNGAPPLIVNSTGFVANLYVARAAFADAAAGGLTLNSTFSASGTSDANITGNSTHITATLKTVNTNVGVWGGNVGLTYLIPQITVNNKGLVTSAANIAVDLDLPHRAVTDLRGTAGQTAVSANVGVSYVSITDPVSVGNLYASGNVAGATVYDNGNRVITSVTAISGNGISVSGATTATQTNLKIDNTGVLGLAGGTGINVSATTGNVSVTNTGVITATGTNGITTSATSGAVSVYPTAGYNGFGRRTVSTAAPSGGSDGDIWYQI